MHALRTILSLSLTLPSLAFRDTSPFFIFSNTVFPHPSSALTSTSSFLDTASSLISSCSADAYILVSQPSVEVSYFSSTNTPNLHSLFSTLERSWPVKNVFLDDTQDPEAIEEVLVRTAVEECEAEMESVDATSGNWQEFEDLTRKPKVVRVNFDVARVGKEMEAVEQNDAFLGSLLKMMPSSNIVVIVTSTPLSYVPPDLGGKPSSTELGNGELKLRSVLRREVQDMGGNHTGPVKGGLFHRYQFFTPAILMGYVALFVMLSIMYVALSAVTGLQVSYGAFEKEMGPAAQKKQ